MNLLGIASLISTADEYSDFLVKVFKSAELALAP